MLAVGTGMTTEACMTPEPFKGTVNVDIRDTVPSRSPFEARIKTQPGKFVLGGEGLCVGRDSGEAVTEDYPGTLPWQFAGGVIQRIAVDVSGEPYVDLARQAKAMLVRE
jgi:hypothetical protein